MSLRYTPLQHSQHVIEEDPNAQDIWNRSLRGMPVVAGALHSQLAPVAAALHVAGSHTYPIVTDAASLQIAISRLSMRLQQAGLIGDEIVVGQAFGSRSAVTLHNALLYTRHLADQPGCAFVCQGPGNTGTSTKYGFSGIEQASNLDIAAALGGIPIACIRASDGDQRPRHQGISHHTLTVLELVRSRCIVPVPEGLEPPAEWTERHDVRVVPRERTQAALDRLKALNITITTMGRTDDQDPLFFHSAAAAGIIAAELISDNQCNDPEQ